MPKDNLIEKKNIQLLKSACRNKHLNNQSNFSFFNLIKYKIKKFLYHIPFNKKFTWHQNLKSEKNVLQYNLPNSSVIPHEFVRLEPWEMEYLYSVAKFAKKGILELGRFNGGSTILFSLANPEVKKYSIDIEPQDDDKLLKILENLDCNKNLTLIIGDSQKTKYDNINSYDFLFIDGDHSYEGCLNDLNNWWQKLNINGSVILHDCYLGSEVQQAVVDFLVDKNVKMIVSPYQGTEHWNNRVSGSLCHFIKKFDNC